MAKQPATGGVNFGRRSGGIFQRRLTYNVHHIVEQASAQNAEEKTRIEQSDNMVLIPTLKHWELNGWYARKDVRFGGLSPRDYLEGRSWEERQRVGLIGLRAVGVLK